MHDPSFDQAHNPLPSQFPSHLVEPKEGMIHDLFAGTHFGGGDLCVGAVTPFGGSLDGGKVLMVTVAVTEEEYAVEVRTLPQPNRMFGEKLTGDSH